MRKILEGKWITLFMGFAFFFMLIHYYGFFSDGSLYLLQVVHYIDPSRFENDVPYMFGNQDSYSFFSPIVSVFFKIFGINIGGIIATLIGQLLWCISAMIFFKCWLEKYVGREYFLPAFFSFLIVFCAKQCYCGIIGFYFVEPILVARFYSIAFIFLGMAFIPAEKKYTSFSFFFIASLLHPLMGIWGVILWLFLFFPRYRIFVVVVVLLSPLTGFFHIGKFDFYSADWLNRPLEYTPTFEDSITYAVLIAFWVAMWRRIENLFISKFSLNMLIVILCALYLQYVGAYSEHILLHQVQPFRVWWIALMSAVPVFCAYIKQLYRNNVLLEIRDCLVLFVSMAAFTCCQHLVVLAVPLILLLLFFWNRRKFYVPYLFSRLIYVTFFFVLALEIGLNNFIQLSIGHGFMDPQLAIKWIDVPDYLMPIRMILLLVVMAVCVFERRFWQAVVFGISFCNNHFLILPLFAVLFCFWGDLKSLFGKILFVVMIAVSLTELIGTADTNVQIGISFIIVVLVFSSVLIALYFKHFVKSFVLCVWFALTCLISWDIFVWDNRTIERKLDEKQMDAFFDNPVFPQIRNRGRILMVENREFTLLSRFKFLTGNYGDESIHVGEVFYKDQFHEALRRKSALFYGDSSRRDFSHYRETINMVYANPDTLLSRTKYLCDIGDISHLATDYGNLPLFKTDSVYLDVKKKYFFLYECPIAFVK